MPVLLAALCAFSFCRGFHGTEFVMDAVSLVEENPRLRPGASMWELVTTNYWGDKGFAGLYRPVSLLSFRLDYQVFGFGDRPQDYVGVSLFLHILVTLLLWRLSRIWNRSRWPSGRGGGCPGDRKSLYSDRTSSDGCLA